MGRGRAVRRVGEAASLSRAGCTVQYYCVPFTQVRIPELQKFGARPVACDPNRQVWMKPHSLPFKQPVNQSTTTATTATATHPNVWVGVLAPGEVVVHLRGPLGQRYLWPVLHTVLPVHHHDLRRQTLLGVSAAPESIGRLAAVVYVESACILCIGREACKASCPGAGNERWIAVKQGPPASSAGQAAAVERGPLLRVPCTCTHPPVPAPGSPSAGPRTHAPPACSRAARPRGPAAAARAARRQRRPPPLPFHALVQALIAGARPACIASSGMLPQGRAGPEEGARGPPASCSGAWPAAASASW